MISSTQHSTTTLYLGENIPLPDAVKIKDMIFNNCLLNLFEFLHGFEMLALYKINVIVFKNYATVKVAE